MPTIIDNILELPNIIENINNDNKQIINISLILKNLSNNLTCSICQDLPTQPYLLPNCGHTFCYSCIKYWFHYNPSCPICRSIIGDVKPVFNHTLKLIIDSIINDLKISLINYNESLSSKFDSLYNTWYKEKNEEFITDKKNNFPWLTKLSENWGRAVVDQEDGVPRCSACHWELIDGRCENCGRSVVGWQSRNDGDDLDVDEDDVESEDEDEDDNHRDENLISRSHYTLASDDDLDDDYNDYDNGLHDMSGRIVLNEAEEDDDVEIDENEDDEGDDVNEESFVDARFNDDYESDDGFIVDDDEMEEDQINNDIDENDDIDDIVDESGFLSGDEDIVKSRRNIVNLSDDEPTIVSEDDTNDLVVNKRNRQSLFVNDDSDDSDIDQDIDQDSDDDLKISKSYSRKKIISDDDEDVDEDENDSTTFQPKRHKHKHKHKHKHHHKHSKKRRN